MTDKTHSRARQPFHVRPHRDGFAITGGPTDFDATLGVVFDNGQPDPEELAKIWAAAQPVMFPALAQNRNEARAILNAGRADIPVDVIGTLRRIEQTAASALPVPTIGDLAEDLGVAQDNEAMHEAIQAIKDERDAALAQAAAMREAIKGFQWSICESEVLRDPSLNATERRIFTDIVGWREKALSTGATPPTAQGGEGGDHAE